MVSIAIELTLGIELPVACLTIAGNGQKGNQYITIKEQILPHHGKTSRIDQVDAKYDEHHNYEFPRSHGAIPIIDCNLRSQNLTAAAFRYRKLKALQPATERTNSTTKGRLQYPCQA